MWSGKLEGSRTMRGQENGLLKKMRAGGKDCLGTKEAVASYLGL
jgi:hypothetical protein